VASATCAQPAQLVAKRPGDSGGEVMVSLIAYDIKARLHSAELLG
jgi:hypothetical protein